ncbi:hypothetical protein SEVIR_7G018052v4 [Setaria viridis]
MPMWQSWHLILLACIPAHDSRPQSVFPWSRWQHPPACGPVAAATDGGITAAPERMCQWRSAAHTRRATRSAFTAVVLAGPRPCGCGRDPRPTAPHQGLGGVLKWNCFGTSSLGQQDTCPLHGDYLHCIHQLFQK